MVTYNKFQGFVGYLGLAEIQCNTDLFKVALVNSPAPVATNDVFADLTEITAENGYTAGGDDVTNLFSEASGVGTCTATDVVWNASGNIGPFQYVILYDDTPVTAPTDPLIAWWDHGSAITLVNGESFTVAFENGQLFTIASV